LLLGAVTVVLVTALAPDRALPFVLTVVPLDVLVFIFSGDTSGRLVLKPVERLVAVADAVAAGDLTARAEGAETGFRVLSQRLNRMTDYLLDAQGNSSVRRSSRAWGCSPGSRTRSAIRWCDGYLRRSAAAARR
jgi:HAMP domain-containing protein